jgi:murein DD-endopeptidase MepM/ murein hydrolase activator NlpD
MKGFPAKGTARLLSCVALAGLAACSEPLDFDLRGNLGDFSTADAARAATAAPPEPDARGIIAYPTYQVAVARRGDTVTSMAQRIGVDAGELARFNGIDADIPLRPGEIVALPQGMKVATSAAASSGSVDIASVAGAAIDAAPATTPVQTTALPAAPASPVQSGPEPVRHQVRRGETAYTISRLYQVPVKSLGEWNGLNSDFDIREGQFLLIPVANAAPPARGAGTAAASVTEPGLGSATPTPPSAARPLPQDEVAAAQPVEAPRTTLQPATQSAASGAAMIYPVQGKVIRAYQKGRNDGIDIAAAPGTPVNAAADGTVAAITEDADQVPIIVVRHEDNLLTVYANVTGIKVKKDDRVTRGQPIAALRDGDAAYVHFEVRQGFDSVDPAPYLN